MATLDSGDPGILALGKLELDTLAAQAEDYATGPGDGLPVLLPSPGPGPGELPSSWIPERKQLTIPKVESPEGYYEEAEPYDTSLNDVGADPPGDNGYVLLGLGDGIAWAALTGEHGPN
ncbi:hypothetical protein P7K49_024486 [Saguinus oedipus]|uniref:Uncharacterized protein n=1 Tax=Saguinus oedipus TaxID=9490 RepID=A0ABQ9UPM7_SAGOE|nr:hypothetical protein P7K49_024486 [Saguinus oedipus]